MPVIAITLTVSIAKLRKEAMNDVLAMGPMGELRNQSVDHALEMARKIPDARFLSTHNTRKGHRYPEQTCGSMRNAKWEKFIDNSDWGSGHPNGISYVGGWRRLLGR